MGEWNLDKPEKSQASPQTIEALCSAPMTGTALDCIDIIGQLEHLGNVEAVAPLLRLQTHEHPGVRMAAAKALGSFQYPGVVSGLLEWLRNEPEVMVQTWIVMSLGSLGDKTTVPLLTEALREASSSTLRHIIIRVLGTLGDRRAIDIILTYASDEDRHVRKDVEEAVQRLRGK